MNGKELKIIACESGSLFAKNIDRHLKRLLGKENDQTFSSIAKSEEVVFANHERKTVIGESIRGTDTYVVQLLDDPLSSCSVNDNLIALSTAINASYQSDAYRVTAVIPQFPYARQDKKKGREPITAKIAGRLLEIAGAKHAITLDVHSEAIEGFFEKLKLQNLHMGRILLDFIQKEYLSKPNSMMVVAPDVGSAKRGVFFAKNLGVDLAIIDKVRDYSRQSNITKMRLVGSVEGKDVLITDDMLATGGTALNACKLMKDKGAEKIYIAVALPFFSGNAIERFREGYEQGLFQKVIGTNAVCWGEKLEREEWYLELDISELFAKVIYNLHIGKSVSTLLA